MGIENKDKKNIEKTSLFDPFLGYYPNLHPVFNKPWVRFILVFLFLNIITDIYLYFFT